jgi:hypothetical protein
MRKVVLPVWKRKWFKCESCAPESNTPEAETAVCLGLIVSQGPIAVRRQSRLPRKHLPDAGTAKIAVAKHHRHRTAARAKLAIIPWGKA